MAKPYYEQYPNVEHAVFITIDDHEFKYDVPNSKDGNGKYKGGWKALVRFVNDVDRLIEEGEIDTRQGNGGGDPGQHTQFSPNVPGGYFAEKE